MHVGLNRKRITVRLQQLVWPVPDLCMVRYQRDIRSVPDTAYHNMHKAVNCNYRLPSD